MKIKFVTKDKLFRKDSHDMVLDILRYNTLRNKFINCSNSSIIKSYNEFAYRTNARTFEDFVELCRDYKHSGPFENLADSGKWYSDGCSNLSIINGVTGVAHSVGTGAAETTFEPYLGAFIDSFNFFKISIKENHYANFKASVGEGIASIESFIREQANIYNYRNPDKQLIDGKQNKVSFIDKIDKWIPVMTGKKLDKGTKEWAAFKKLNSFRDHQYVHLKNVYGVSYEELLSLMNMYRFGIPGLLMKLYILFNLYVPSNIIRAKYYPEILIVTSEDKMNE